MDLRDVSFWRKEPERQYVSPMQKVLVVITAGSPGKSTVRWRFVCRRRAGGWSGAHTQGRGERVSWEE